MIKSLRNTKKVKLKTKNKPTMQRMHSPWRSKYIASFSEPQSGECIFCKAYNEKQDDANLIVARGKFCFVIMNIYPYNSGHLMVVPNRHTNDLINLTDDESLEVMSFLKLLSYALSKIMNPDGFNIGSNIGRSAGAGIDHHIHFHIVPRWMGDTNFMPIISDTKVISEDIKDTHRKLKNILSSAVK